MKREYQYYEQPKAYGLKHYKEKDGLTFDYIDKKICKRKKEMKVIGSIDLKRETNKHNRELLRIKSGGKEYCFEILPKGTCILGYLEVEEDTYVSIIKSNRFFIWLSVLILLMIGGLVSSGLYSKSSALESNQEIVEDFASEDGEDIVYEKPLTQESVQETITIPGYANLKISSQAPFVSLINPEGNTVYMKYIIMKEGEMIYETKAFPPNKMIKVNLKELLPIGKSQVEFLIQTFDVETKESCNGATQKVDVWVEQ